MSSIISKAELASYKGETLDDTRATQVTNAINAHIETVTGRVWGETKTVTEEPHDYAPVIFLRNMDITELTKVERGHPADDDEILPSTSYKWNSLGRLVLGTRDSRSIRPGYDEVFVTYTHGVETVPTDLKLAALSLASGYYDFAADGDAEVTAERIGSYQLSYARGSDSQAGRGHNAVIASYRKQHV